MGSDPPETSVEELREAVHECEQRLHIISAVDRALEDPVRVLAVIVDAENVEDATRSIRQELSLDEVQAAAILDLQWRRATRADRARAREMRDDLLRTLRELNDTLTHRA